MWNASMVGRDFVFSFLVITIWSRLLRKSREVSLSVGEGLCDVGEGLCDVGTDTGPEVGREGKYCAYRMHPYLCEEGGREMEYVGGDGGRKREGGR